MSTSPDIYNETTVSRKSPGLFGYIYTFQSTPFLLLLFFGLPLTVGGIVMIFHWFSSGTLNWMYMIRDASMFATITIIGTLGCLWLRERTPLFTVRIAYLMNAFGTGMFAVSYLAGNFLDTFLTDDHRFVEMFFILGALVAYIVLFVVFFSFTRVGAPWHILLALIQPVTGILIYSFYSEQVTIIFFSKAIIFFMVSATIFALGYGPMMMTVSTPFRRQTGIGGYNFVRAFVEALLLDNHEHGVEGFFEKFSEARDLQIQYLAFRKPGATDLKGLFLIPNVHFGPFKTAGSAALAERIYQTFNQIGGITVFHTTTTHGENLSSRAFNSQVVSQIKEDLTQLEFKTPEVTRFFRTIHEKTKILGCVFNNQPFMMLTRHPYPTDDIVPSVGQKIQSMGEAADYKPALVVDCHNSLIGDEVLVEAGSEEAREIIETSAQFFEHLKKVQEQTYNTISYGVARDPVGDLPIEAGIGGGGIIVHLFKIGEQETAIIHIDANNAITPVRSAIVNLGENAGLDRIELSTSDTHAVVRILSSQGYYPLGTRISSNNLVDRVKKLIKTARADLTEVEVAQHTSTTPGYRFWKDIAHFDVIIETIERSLSVSKYLLTIGLVFPALFTLIIMLFYY